LTTFKDIFECFNRIFFFGAAQAKVVWRELDVNVQGEYDDENRAIYIAPIYTCVDPDHCDARRRERLATILHEAAHAF
jgi:hypothetical protein